jgi:hypothetical protein
VSRRRPLSNLGAPNMRQHHSTPKSVCSTGKVAYSTELDAEMARAWLTSNRPSGARRNHRRSYLCRECGGWHHTSKADRPR